MRATGLLGPALFGFGLVLLGIGFARGEASLALVLIFPVVAATGWVSGTGILLMVVAFLVSFFLWPSREVGEPVSATESSPAASGRTASPNRWGGVVFLGPIPIVLGSDARVTRGMLVLALALFVALVIFTVVLLAI